MDAIKLMLLPFAECLVLVGIHSYLGIHVIRRGVIFVDLALAQIAALGTTVAFLFHIAPHSRGAYVFSLCFTFVGAAVFSLTRFRKGKIPQEAIIGLVYALTAAFAILVVDRAPHGAEHVKEILTGSILWVKASTVVTAAVVYLFVGIFHYIFRKKFLMISTAPEEAYRKGISIRFWDFLFYMSFGLVITHSVGAAGVLLVFIFLVVPAIIAIMLTDRLFYQLIIGWSMGALVSVLGLTLSYQADLPSGPAVVTFYGLILLIAAIFLYVGRSVHKARALLNIAAGVALTAMLFLAFYHMGNWFSAHKNWSHVDWRHGHEQRVQMAEPRAKAGSAELLERLNGLDLVGKEYQLKDVESGDLLKELISMDGIDDEIKLTVGARLLELHEKAGVQVLLDLMRNSKVPIFREDALSRLKSISGDDFDYDPWSSPEPVNRESLDRWYRWFASRYKKPL